MNVILLERIEKLGQMGDVVTVKPGYARNYLLPSKKALRAIRKIQQATKPSVRSEKFKTPRSKRGVSYLGPCLITSA